MRRGDWWRIVALAGLVIGGGTAVAAAPAEQAAAGAAGLAWRLVRASGAGNAIVSPVSVWEALAMTHAGARGETAAEIAAVLGMPDDRAAIAAASAALRQACAEAKGEKIKLEIANRIWVQRGRPLEESFTSLLEGKFAAGAGLVDFQSRPEDARVEINRWVGERTAGKIDELLKSGSVTSATRLVLTNAVYMKAPWATPFPKPATQPAPFTLASGARADVPFMQRTARMRAGRVGAGPTAARVCEVPYAGERLAMVLVVPEATAGLPAVLEGLGADWRGATIAAAEVRPREVMLALPRWTARKPLTLNAVLVALGMKQAFAPGAADFSGMDGTRELSISEVVHEGFVEVTEEGTEAAAATGVVMRTTSVVVDPDPPLEIRADRPFAWAVVERGTGAVLFAGVVADPR